MTRLHGVQSTRRCPTAIRGRTAHQQRPAPVHFDRIPSSPWERFWVSVFVRWRTSESFPYRAAAGLDGAIDSRRMTVNGRRSPSASRAERIRGNVRSPRRRSYASARRPGLLGTMVVVSRMYQPGHRRSVPSKGNRGRACDARRDHTLISAVIGYHFHLSSLAFAHGCPS